MNKEDAIGIIPSNLGWLEYRLNSQEMEYVWGCIKKKKDDHTGNLAGNISGSYKLMDRGDWFFHNTLKPLFLQYGKQFANLGEGAPVNPDLSYPFQLSSWWVNYQKQTEFNPSHTHTGVYSFVIWLKIPTKWEEQHNLPFMDGVNDAYRKASDFEFEYCDLLGDIRNHSFRLDKKMEGRMLFFPAGLRHTVYPFYNCEEPRISVAGNVWFKTK